MTRRLPFEYWQTGQLFWARYLSAEHPPVHENWTGLWDVRALESIDYAHFKEFAVNGNNAEEVAVYLRIIWELLRGGTIVGDQNVPSAHARLHAESALVHIQSFRDLSLLTQSVLRGPIGEIRLFDLGEHSVSALADTLDAANGPSVSDVLVHGDPFVALGIGVDTGYNDYILIASTQPLEPRLLPIVHAAESAIAQYEEQLTDDTTPHEFLRLLTALAGQ